MIAGDLRPPVVAKIVFGRCVLAVVRFQQGNEVGWKIVPETSWLCLTRQVSAQRRFAAIAAGHWQITRQSIVDRWNIGGALDRRVTTKDQGSSARATEIDR